MEALAFMQFLTFSFVFLDTLLLMIIITERNRK